LFLNSRIMSVTATYSRGAISRKDLCPHVVTSVRVTDIEIQFLFGLKRRFFSAFLLPEFL